MGVNFSLLQLLQIEPSPDWKGGVAGHRNEVRRLERKRNPGKWVEIASMQFLPTSFLRKLAISLLQPPDAPSLALSVCEWVGIAWSLAGHGVPDTVKDGVRSRKKMRIGN